jgi:hypothetical protein
MEIEDITERISTDALQEKVGELENMLCFMQVEKFEWQRKKV